jgi:hypothetical protein
MSGLVESALRRLFVVHRTAVAAAVTAALLLLPSAAAAGVRIESRETIVPAARALSSASPVLAAGRAPYRFNMIGIHWRGSGSVSLRTATRVGQWSAWRSARPEAEDAPDPDSSEADPAVGWTLGTPLWTGPADRIQYRITGPVWRIRAFFVASPVARTAQSQRVAQASQLQRVAQASQPKIILRKAWDANESIVRARPSYAARLAFAVVHHTAGAQPSSPAQSAAIVRGIQTYHVKGNGWNDIGYNFLVDRYGQIFEGRGGGIAANVIGAHAKGFNTGSVGVAVIGAFSSSPISADARKALVSLLAWRLDLAHVNPRSRLTRLSAGNAQYPPGRAVRLRAVSGHRDTGPTTCPGDALHRGLPSLARSIRARGRPKIYAPRTKGRQGGMVRVRARVDPARAWTVTVTDAHGASAASGNGRGARVDWTWDSSSAPAGTYRWTISAGRALPASGLVGSRTPSALRLASARARPRVVSPNGDGHKDKTRLEWQTTVPAEVRVRVHTRGGRVVGTAYPWTPIPAGNGAVRWNGDRLNGNPIPDGWYTLEFAARAGSISVVKEAPITFDRTLGAVAIVPNAFSPNGDRRLDTTAATFSLARDARVVVKVSRRGGPAGTVFEGRLPAGERRVNWDGQLDGLPVSDGLYTLSVSATTRFGSRRLRRPVTVDTTRPVVTDVAAERTRRGTRVRFRVDEPGRAVVRFGEVVARVVAAAGRNRVWRRIHVERVGVRTRDAAGNQSRLRSAPVV